MHMIYSFVVMIWHVQYDVDAIGSMLIDYK